MQKNMQITDLQQLETIVAVSSIVASLTGQFVALVFSGIRRYGRGREMAFAAASDFAMIREDLVCLAESIETHAKESRAQSVDINSRLSRLEGFVNADRKSVGN